MTSYAWPADILTQGGGGPNVVTLDGTNGALTLASIANPSASTLTLTGGTALTTSQPVLKITQGWANAAVTFTADLLNVTDTASAVGSKLFDRQLSGNSLLSLTKQSILTLSSVSAYPKLVYSGNSLGGSSSGTGFVTLLGYNVANNKQFWYGDPDYEGNSAGRFIRVVIQGSSASLDVVNGTNNTAYPLNLSSGLQLQGHGTYLYSDIDGNLAQRNGTNAQTLRVYNTYTDASNYERGVLDWGTTSNVLTIGTQKAGTGSTRNWKIIAGGTSVLDYGVTHTGALTITSDVGSGLYVEGGGIQVTVPGGIGSTTYIYWLSSTTFHNRSDGVLTVSNYAENDFGRLQFGGTTSSFPALKRSSATLQVRLADDSGYAALRSETLTVTQLGSTTPSIVNSADSTTGIAFYSTSNFAFVGAGSATLYSLTTNAPNAIGIPNGLFFGFEGGFSGIPKACIGRDADNIIAIRNPFADAAQTLRLYNTYTDASNYERGVFDWGTTSNVLTIGTQKAGTGTNRSIALVAASSKVYIGAVASFAATGHEGPLNIQIDGAGTGFVISNSSSEYTRFVSGGVLKGLLGNGTVPFYVSNDGPVVLTPAASGGAALVCFSGETSSYPALKRSSATLQVRLADDSADADIGMRAAIHNGVTYANRPGTPTAGMVIYVTDSNTATWGATVAGGSTNKVLAWYNGTNWTVAGA